MIRKLAIAFRAKVSLLNVILQGLANLSTRILGSNTLVQGALPEILENTPQAFFNGIVDTLYVSISLGYFSHFNYLF